MPIDAVTSDRLGRLNDYPFARLAALLADVTPRANLPPLPMHVGDPQHAPPALLTEAIARFPAEAWGRYPPMLGTPEWQAAVLGWLDRRYRLPRGMLDASCLMPLGGTREGLFLAGQLCVPAEKGGGRPVVLMPNPFYAVYEGAGVMAGAEPVFLPAGPATGFLPDLSAIPEETLARAALMFLTSPANPQGTFAGLDYLKTALGLARTFGFTLAVDECYADVYDAEPPPGALEAAAELGGDRPLANLIVFHSLSKRSSAAGLRSGFCAGDPRLMKAFGQLRSYSYAGTPVPALAAAAALWADDAHAEETRRLYREKFDAAEAVLSGRFGFYRPPGGFFLWLDVGDGVAAAERLWREGAIRVLPGAYLTRPDATGTNHGVPYVRVALVHDTPTVAEACARLADLL